MTEEKYSSSRELEKFKREVARMTYHNFRFFYNLLIDSPRAPDELKEFLRTQHFIRGEIIYFIGPVDQR